jgi:hypothetical protein
LFYRCATACAVVLTMLAFGAMPAFATNDPQITSSRSADDGGSVDGEGYTLPGDVLTASLPPEDLPATYQWQNCGTIVCTDIPGATAATYTVQSSDLGDNISVTVDPGSSGFQLERDPQVGAPLLASIDSNPYLSTSRTNDGGGASNTWIDYVGEGDTLTVSPGTWVGDPTSYSYQWQDCSGSGMTYQCTNVGSGTQSYTVQHSDLGGQLMVNVTGTNAYGSSTWTAFNTPSNTGAPVSDDNGSGPAITSSNSNYHADSGDTLTTTTGAWLGDPTSYTYQWQDCDNDYHCTAISGATSPSYTLALSDRGSEIEVDVTATNGVGSSDGPDTGYFGYAVVGAPASADNMSLPVLVNGQTVAYDATPAPGDVLSVSDGTWVGAPATITHAWLRCPPMGNSCATIDGAVNSTYTLTSADSGFDVGPAVFATNAYGSQQNGGAFYLVGGNSSAPSGGSTTPATTPATTRVVTGETVSVQVPQGVASSATVPATTGTTTGTAPTIAWAQATFASAVTITASLTPSAMQAGNKTVDGFSAGSVELNLVITDAAGNQVHQFAAPLDLTFPNPAQGFAPAYSEDGVTWIAIPKLAGTTLADGQQDGYYVAADGSVHVLTRHATDFGLLTGLSLWGSTNSVVKHGASSLVVHVSSGRNSSATVRLQTRGGKVLRTVSVRVTKSSKAVKLVLPKHTKPGTYLVKVHATSSAVSATKTFVVRIK